MYLFHHSRQTKELAGTSQFQPLSVGKKVPSMELSPFPPPGGSSPANKPVQSRGIRLGCFRIGGEGIEFKLIIAAAWPIEPLTTIVPFPLLFKVIQEIQGPIRQTMASPPSPTPFLGSSTSSPWPFPKSSSHWPRSHGIFPQQNAKAKCPHRVLLSLRLALGFPAS